MSLRLTCALVLAIPPLVRAQDACWIWAVREARDGQSCQLRREFEIAGTVRRARIAAACDNHFEAKEARSGRQQQARQCDTARGAQQRAP
jgi:hypothetical protein